jgi:sugar lactone lactonase YvrE
MAMTSGRIFRCLCRVLLISAAAASASAEPNLFESRQVTPAGEYTSGIEGPAADREGNLFVVNMGRPGTIGRLAAGGSHSEKFIDLPQGSVGNAIRFDSHGTMFVADYRKHSIFAIKQGSLAPEVIFHSDLMSQPNDITVARDGTIYASDPNWKGRNGRIWRIWTAADGQAQGAIMAAPRAMGTTNGIDLSPDDTTLYVGESNNGQLWAYGISGNELMSPRLVRTFEADSIDGLRTDVDGKLLIARIRKGLITVMRPDATSQQDVVLKGMEPTNLAFGGPDGRTVFVTQRQGRFIESFRTDREGREHCIQWAGC